MEKSMDEYKSIFTNLKSGEYFGRLGKTFKAAEKYYFLDTGTGKIAEVNENVYLVLSCMLENDGFEALKGLKLSQKQITNALEEIIEAVEKEHILSAYKLETMTGEPVVNLEKTYESCISNLTLEVTDVCNLRCKYCIYQEENPSFRGFGNRKMTFDTAKKAIDFFIQHSYDQEEIYIGFYGGEPLINFELIKKAVGYAGSQITRQKVIYSMTTNATLMTREIADFLAEHNFDMLISLDGSEKIHNSNRVFADGKGSFQATVDGTKMLLEAFERHNKIPSVGFSMVTSGPDYNSKYSEIQAFFDEADWLPENYILMTSTVSTCPEDSPYMLPQSKEERECFKNLSVPLIDWDGQQEMKKDRFSMAYMNKNLAIIHKRLLTKEPVKEYGMNGCCVPGGRRIYISVEGEIYPCEKIGDVPSLGNIEFGLDIEKIRKHYVTDFINEAQKYCKNCWAVNLCTLCYVDCYDKNGTHFEYRNRNCVSERKFLELLLSKYHEVLEKDPNRIETLNQMEFL